MKAMGRGMIGDGMQAHHLAKSYVFSLPQPG